MIFLSLLYKFPQGRLSFFVQAHNINLAPAASVFSINAQCVVGENKYFPEIRYRAPH